MRRSMLLLFVAVGLWLLQAEAVTRDDFLMQTTQDLVDVCSVKPGEPSYEGALGFVLATRLGLFSTTWRTRRGSPQDPFICCLSRARHERTLPNGSWPGLEKSTVFE